MWRKEEGEEKGRQKTKESICDSEIPGSVFVVLHISRHFNFLECPVALAADFYREPKKKKCQDH